MHKDSNDNLVINTIYGVLCMFVVQIYLLFPIIDFTLNYTLDLYDDFQLAQLVNYLVVK